MLVYVVLEPEYRYKVVQYSYRIMGSLKDSTLYRQDDRNLARHHLLRVESSPGKWVRRVVFSIY